MDQLKRIYEAFSAEKTFDISGRYFQDIAQGPKTHEGRGGNSRMATATKPGDWLRITQGWRWYLVRRGEACHHNSVEGLLTCPQHPNMLPGTNAVADQIEVYRRFGLTPEVARTHGALAIRLTPMTPIIELGHYWVVGAAATSLAALALLQRRGRRKN